MKSKISFGRVVNGSTTWMKDKTGHTDHIIREQAGQQVYFTPAGHRLGHIDSLGRTVSARGRILNSQPRPDLLLNRA